MSEKLCLLFINELLSKYGPGLLLGSGFVDKWLAKQNWGDDEEERKKNFQAYVTNENKQNRIVEIVRQLQDVHHGRAALVKANLVGQEPPTSGPSTATVPGAAHLGHIMALNATRPPLDRDGSVPPLEGEAQLEALMGLNATQAQTSLDGGEQPPASARAREQTEEGQRIRRQHREAMVISDGTGPLGREHIIERGHP